MATPANLTDSGKTVLIGASHLCRTAEHLPDCISLAQPGFKPTLENLREIERKVRKIDPDEKDLVVMDLISNVATWALMRMGCHRQRLGLAMVPTTSQARLLQYPR
jgi:hypothetical protein